MKKNKDDNGLFSSKFNDLEKSTGVLLKIVQLLEKNNTTVDEAIKICTAIVFNSLEDKKVKSKEIEEYLEYMITRIKKIINYKQK